MTQRLRNGSHHKAVFESAKLSNWHRWMWHRMATVNVDLKSILHALQAKKIPFVLTGAHGISGWTGEPRGTQDVAILVKSGRNHARAVKALQALYPQLEVHQLAGDRPSYDSGVISLRLDGKKTEVVSCKRKKSSDWRG